MKRKYPTKESETKEAKKWKVYSQKALDTLYKTPVANVGKFFDNVSEFSQETYKKASKSTKKAAKTAGKTATRVYKAGEWTVLNVGLPTVGTICGAGAVLFAYNMGSPETAKDIPIVGEILQDFTPKESFTCTLSLSLASLSQGVAWIGHKRRKKERDRYESFVAELRETHGKEVKKLERNYQNLLGKLREDMERSQTSRHYLKHQLKGVKRTNEESRAESEELKKEIRRLRKVEEEQTISIKELLKKMKYIEKIQKEGRYIEKAANPGSKE